MDKSQWREKVILTVIREDRDVTIRIDQDSLAFSQLQEAPVVNLILYSCDNAEGVFEDVCEFVDRPVDYTTVEKGDATHVSLRLDYGVLELEVKCVQATKSDSEYTLDDWKRKINRLSFLYLDCKWQSEANEQVYNLLRETLQQMIRKEIERTQRKIDFLQKTNPDKASFLAGAMAAYQNVLAKMDEIEKKQFRSELQTKFDEDKAEHWKKAGRKQTAQHAVQPPRPAA